MVLTKLTKCLNYGKNLTRKQQKFCSMKCVGASSQKMKLECWLSTGKGNLGHNHFDSIRRFILKEQKGKCAICGLGDVWNNRPLHLLLDHIDGNSDNNEENNVRLICPNCDSQLPTYKGKNKGYGRHFRRERYKNGQSY